MTEELKQPSWARIVLSEDKFRGAKKVYAKFHGRYGAMDLIGTHGICSENGAYVATLGDGTEFRDCSFVALRNQIDNHVFA